MSQSRKNRNKGSSETPVSHKTTVDRQNRRSAIIIALAVVVLILVIVGVSVYPTYIAPFRRNVITVNDINIRMDYLIKRIKLSGSDPIGMLTQLTNDQIIKLGAPRYGITVNQADIDSTLRSMYQGQTSANFSEGEFNEWYRQLLNESGLSEAEYKDIITTEQMRARLQDHLASMMPTVAEHVHLHIIAVSTLNEAENVITKWESGTSFSDLAKQYSLDKTTGEKGGEVGWFPSGGVLTPQIEFEAFQLATGNISQPVASIADQEQPDGSTAPTVVGYNLLMVSEKAIRQLDDNALNVLKSKVLDTWFEQERQNYTIKWRGLTGDAFDSETYAWINYQVAKAKSASTGSSSQQSTP